MTEAGLLSQGLMLAQAAPADSAASPWSMPLMVLAMGAIWYFLIIRPMQKQKKAKQLFLEALKVGDRIVTTGGIFGVITKLSDKSVQVQIADKVRIDISKAAVTGFQGQDPVAPESANQ